MKLDDELSCRHNETPVCPHCGDQWKLSKHDRALDVSYVEGGYTDCKCDGCGEPFVAVTEISYSYSTAIDEDHASDELWGPQEPSEVAQGLIPIPDGYAEG